MAAVFYNDWLEDPDNTSRDRLNFAIFIAALLHGVLILGVTFTFLDRGVSTHTLEVTLAQHQSSMAPDKADFLAQFDQEGSGTLEQKQLITSPEQSPFHDTEIKETTNNTFESSPKQVEKQTQETLATSANASMQTIIGEAVTQEEISESQMEKAVRLRSLEIASLEARLDELRQIHANRPRIKRLTSLSTKSSADAYYLNSWRKKIEVIGNLNYPDEAKRSKLYGSLRLMVAISPDGNVKEIEILESSGHQVLDEAAIRIVRLASPYEPFPAELRRSTDLLEIIRTWQFRKNSSLRSY